MPRLSLAIALHFHQPIGNFEHIFERAYKFCYRPFLELLSSYPEIKMMFHISGCLLDYLEAKHPGIIRLVGSMLKRNQVEIMGGAYYEPILTAIPREDAIGQIKMMSGYIRKRFRVVPEGVWIAERVWDPALSGLLYKSGMRYLVLDDEHIMRSGKEEEDVHGYFLTGGGDKKIAVFPSNKKLRYLIPFRPIQELTDYLRDLAINGKGILVTYGDDGEKFGEWPGTYTHVYENKWLNNFFDMLMQNRDWIETVHFSECLRKYKAHARLEIHQGSYKEMMEWSGNCWLNFLSRYPEADHMHKKMLYVSAKLRKAKRKMKGTEIKDIENAQRYLYKGQCNCAYWHGVFGGLYLYHLRKGVYDNLIAADRLIEKAAHKSGKGWVGIHKLDFDLDGRKEVIIENRDFSVYVDPYEGGIIKELDYMRLPFNLVNTLSRRIEPYHKKILERAASQTDGSKIPTIHDDFRKVDPSFRDVLIYDKFNRYFLRTFFVQGGLTLTDLLNSSYREIGDFSRVKYSVDIKNGGIILEGRSIIENSMIRLYKEIRASSRDELKFNFRIKKEGPAVWRFLFGLEFNVTMPELNSERYFYHADAERHAGMNSKGYVSRPSSFGISDARHELGISFRFSENPVRIFYFPVQTVSQSERAYDLNYQCSCIFGLWDIELKSDAEHSFNAGLIFERD